MNLLGRETLTIIRAAQVRQGTSLVRDWAHATETAYTGCNFQPLSAAEVTADREFAESHFRVFGPYGIDLVSTDRVRRELTGVVYDAEGDAQHLSDIDSKPSHAEALVKIRTG